MEMACMVTALLFMLAVVVAKVLTARWLRGLRSEIREAVAQVRLAQERVRIAQAQHDGVKAGKLAVERRIAKLEKQISVAHRELRGLAEEADRRASKLDQTERVLVR